MAGESECGRRRSIFECSIPLRLLLRVPPLILLWEVLHDLFHRGPPRLVVIPAREEQRLVGKGFGVQE